MSNTFERMSDDAPTNDADNKRPGNALLNEIDAIKNDLVTEVDTTKEEVVDEVDSTSKEAAE